MKKINLILVIILLPGVINAQSQKEDEYKYWMTFGIYLDATITLNFSYSFSLGDYFYKAGYQLKDDILKRSDYHFRSVDVSIGKRIQTEWFQFSLFAGPSYVFGEKRLSPGEYDKFYTAGLQTDGQALFRLADEVGIGLGVYANLNFEKSYTGVNINFTLGNGK